MKPIPIARPLIGEQEKREVLSVLDSGMLASGEWVERFEGEFAAQMGVRYAVATSSGTTALHTALRALGIGEGDLVVTTPFTFIASSNAVLYCRGEPVFADIDPATFNLDPSVLRRVLENNPGVRALVVVHLFGLPAPMDEIMDLVREYDLFLIEDCAQAHGARYRGRAVGTFGDLAAFSFYPTKNMTTGEGGILLTDDRGLEERTRALISHGAGARYHHDRLGYNYRMTNIAAALGLIQLRRLKGFNRRRRDNARRLSEGLRDLSPVRVPGEPPGCEHVFHQYTVRAESRDQLASHLEGAGIGCGIYYPQTVNSQPLYRELGFTREECPRARQACREVLSLPVHPGLERGELERIVEAVRSFYGH